MLLREVHERPHTTTRASSMRDKMTTDSKDGSATTPACMRGTVDATRLVGDVFRVQTARTAAYDATMPHRRVRRDRFPSRLTIKTHSSTSQPGRRVSSKTTMTMHSKTTCARTPARRLGTECVRTAAPIRRIPHRAPRERTAKTAGCARKRASTSAATFVPTTLSEPVRAHVIAARVRLRPRVSARERGRDR